MNKKQIKELLKAHCTIENGRWVFKQVDIDAASLELEQAIAAKPIVSGALPLNSKVIEVAACKAKEFHGGKSAFSAAYEEGWVDGAVWMRTEAEQQ